MTNSAVKMFDYHVWANQTMMNRLKELPQELYHREITSVFPSIAKVMPHIYFVDYAWLGVLEGQSMKEALAAASASKEAVESMRIDELEVLFSELSERYRAVLSEQESMEKLILLDNPYAGVREISISDIVLQTVNHGTYHRGNITAMLRQLG